jgi:hypothetical protein
VSVILQSWPLQLTIVFVIAGSVFAAHEGWALITHRQTLTEWIRATTKRFPIFIFLTGAFVGWFFQHLWGSPPCQ